MTFERLKARRGTTMTDAYVLLAKPALRGVYKKPPSTAYSFFRKSMESGQKPPIRTVWPGPGRPGWALISMEDGEVIVAANQEHNSITIVARPRFKINNKEFEGAALLAFLRLEAAKYERSYPLFQYYEVGQPSTFFSSAGAKGGKGGGGKSVPRGEAPSRASAAAAASDTPCDPQLEHASRGTRGGATKGSGHHAEGAGRGGVRR